MLQLILPAGEYSIKPRGNQVEISSLDQDLTREEVAVRLGRTERSIDLYRSLEGPAQLKSSRRGGRITIRETELTRWLAYMEANPNDYPTGHRPRKKRRTRLEFNNGRPKVRPLSEAAA